MKPGRPNPTDMNTISQLQDAIVQALAYGDIEETKLLRLELRNALEEMERREIDLKVARMFMASRNLTHINLN